MAESLETLLDRVARLEQLLEARDMTRPSDEAATAAHVWNRIPFSAWLKISGPTFAVMAAGFGFLWSAQQETTARITEVQQELTAQILETQRETTAQIMAVQRESTAQIRELQQETTAQILEVQREILDLQRSTTDRMLDLQGRLLEQQRAEGEQPG